MRLVAGHTGSADNHQSAHVHQLCCFCRTAAATVNHPKQAWSHVAQPKRTAIAIPLHNHINQRKPLQPTTAPSTTTSPACIRQHTPTSYTQQLPCCFLASTTKVLEALCALPVSSLPAAAAHCRANHSAIVCVSACHPTRANCCFRLQQKETEANCFGQQPVNHFHLSTSAHRYQ
jgi:hypothetical protein